MPENQEELGHQIIIPAKVTATALVFKNAEEAAAYNAAQAAQN
jgi:hypothetical protein